MRTEDKSVDTYIGSFPEAVQIKLKEIRQIIRKSAPEATEEISYGMPVYKLNGKPLVYFGGFKNHIGFFALPTGNEAFARELSVYKHGKGSVQFSLNQPLPVTLIEKMVAFRVAENSKK